jgi:hypothetical protein
MPFCISICPSASYVKYDPWIFLLPREVAAEAPEMRSVHLVKSMGLIVDIMNKGNVIRCNTYQYTNWHELGIYPHL